MKEPVINSDSHKILLATAEKLPQSLLLTGDSGIGLLTIGKYVSEYKNIKPIIILPEKDEKIDLEKGVIGVDILRRLYNDTRTKEINKRIIIIDYAERMTHQAQNAFLKLLEEPGDNIHFILLSHSISALLPTILSRVEIVKIKPITNTQSKKVIELNGISDVTKLSQLLYIAEGFPAELTRLCVDDDYFQKRSLIIRDARELLQGKLYDKLSVVHRYKDDRINTLCLLLDMTSIIKRSLLDNPQIDLIKRIDNILEAYSRIEANGNIRLCLARIFV